MKKSLWSLSSLVLAINHLLACLNALYAYEVTKRTNFEKIITGTRVIRATENFRNKCLAASLKTIKEKLPNGGYRDQKVLTTDEFFYVKIHSNGRTTATGIYCTAHFSLDATKDESLFCDQDIIQTFTTVNEVTYDNGVHKFTFKVKKAFLGLGWEKTRKKDPKIEEIECKTNGTIDDSQLLACFFGWFPEIIRESEKDQRVLSRDEAISEIKRRADK